MSFNPCPSGAPPQWYPGEILLVDQNGIEFQVKLGRSSPTQGGATFKAKGHIYLSNVRVLFIADRSVQQNEQTFSSFDIPLRGVLDVKFNQPIFGANNLTGKAQPVNCLGVTEPVEWKVTFNEGGTGVFIPTFLRLMDQLAREGQGPGSVYGSQHHQPHQQQQQQHPQQQHQQHLPPGYGSYGGGEGGQSSIPQANPVAQPVGYGDSSSTYDTNHAYVDPSDPSRVLVGSNSNQQQQQQGGGGDPYALASAPSFPGRKR